MEVLKLKNTVTGLKNPKYGLNNEREGTKKRIG